MIIFENSNPDSLNIQSVLAGKAIILVIKFYLSNISFSHRKNLENGLGFKVIPNFGIQSDALRWWNVGVVFDLLWNC